MQLRQRGDRESEATTADLDILIATTRTLTGSLVELRANSILFRSADGGEARVARDEARVASFEVGKPFTQPKDVAAIQPSQDTVFMRDGTLHSGFVASITADEVLAAGRSLDRSEVYQIVFSQEVKARGSKPPVDEEDPAGRCWAGQITIGQTGRLGSWCPEGSLNVERKTEMEVVLADPRGWGLLEFREVRYRIRQKQGESPECDRRPVDHATLNEEWRGHWKKEDLPAPALSWLGGGYTLEGRKVTYQITGMFVCPRTLHFKGSEEAVPGDPRQVLPPEVNGFTWCEEFGSHTDQDGTPHADPESLVFQGKFDIRDHQTRKWATWDLKPAPCNLPD